MPFGEEGDKLTGRKEGRKCVYAWGGGAQGIHVEITRSYHTILAVSHPYVRTVLVGLSEIILTI